MTAAQTLGTAFADHHRQLWLVGGALRDRLLGRPSQDTDYATDALPDEIEQIAAAIGARTLSVGRRFGTVRVRVGDIWAEITTFRGESYGDGTRWPSVAFGTSIDEDLARRDFTINAMAEDTRTGRLLDPFGGQQDLAARRIRCVGQPARRFAEDPLRILRAARFVSQLEFSLAPETAAAMREQAPLLASLSAERVSNELDRLLAGRAPGPGLRALADCGGLAPALPELSGMPGCEQNSFHRLDVWEHTVVTVEAIRGESEPLRLRRWAALLHDAGKPLVRQRKKNGEWGFYRHETVGAEVAAALLRRLARPREEARTVTLLVRRHMDRPRPEEGRSVRRFIHRCEGHWEDLIALKAADNASHTYDDSAYTVALSEACARIAAADAEALKARSPLSGDDLIALFGRRPGPWIRRLKDRLGAMVLDGDLAAGDRETAAAIARSLVGEDQEDAERRDANGRRPA